MPKFAIYYVPEASSEFYHLGSAILGYDVRARKTVEMPPELSMKLGDFHPSWVTTARPYGFHLTIGDAIDFNPGDIQRIESELSAVLKCFAKEDRFTLQKCSAPFIPNWGAPIVLRYDPNDSLKLFHALVVSRINPLGIGSGYLTRYLKDNRDLKKKSHKAQKIKMFYSPFVLSDFKPHFSLLNPYTGNEREQLVNNLEGIFGDFKDLEVNSVCLLLQLHEGEDWIIYKEINRLME